MMIIALIGVLLVAGASGAAGAADESYYKILGVPRDADTRAIKRA